MNNLDKIYNSILEKVIMPIGDWLNGSCVMEELQRWRTYSTLNTEEIDNIAQMNLENFRLKFIIHCKSIIYKILSAFKKQNRSKNVLFSDSVFFSFH